MRAVIIEKDEKILQQIQSILQKVDSGYELVGTAVNGQSGYELISALRPNLVIMDIELPRMNGMSMLKKLRAEAFDFKVVVLSGTENFQYAKQAIELSVDGYIMKPIRPLELKRALMQICEKMRNEYWLNASFTVENLLIGCMNGQYQPENKLNEITVRNYGFTVEDSCGMFILWLGEDFEKNKAEAVHLLKRSLQKENKFRVCILPLEVWQEIFVIVYQTAEFEMAEQYFQENIVPMLCSNLNGDVVCVWKRIDHMMDLWQYRTKIPLLRQWNLTLGRGVLISEKGIAGRELELLQLKYPAELELRARDCTLAGRKKELEKCFEELCEMLEGQFCFPETLKDCLIRFSLNIVNMYKIQWELGAEIQVLILILEIGQATSWKQIRRAIEELLNYFNFEKEDLQGNEAFSTMVRKAVEMAKKYNVELVVRSSLNQTEGTVVGEGTGMEKLLVTGVAADKNTARISVIGVEDKPGTAFSVFDTLAANNINVDIILQSVGREGTKDISFTVASDDLEHALEVLDKNKERLTIKDITYNKDVAKLSVVGAGMMSNPGVASRMFEALYNSRVNINMISTSEIRITVLVAEKDIDKAMNAVHDEFIMEE